MRIPVEIAKSAYNSHRCNVCEQRMNAIYDSGKRKMTFVWRCYSRLSQRIIIKNEKLCARNVNSAKIEGESNCELKTISEIFRKHDVQYIFSTYSVHIQWEEYREDRKRGE